MLFGPSSRPDCDVDYLFGAASIDKPFINWSGNCGNLTSAVGPFAIEQRFVKAAQDGVAIVRIWQANINAKIIAHVPVRNGEVVEEGEFELDGVTFLQLRSRSNFSTLAVPKTVKKRRGECCLQEIRSIRWTSPDTDHSGSR